MEPITRRQALTGAASSILIVAPETAFGYQANSAVSFGVIGTGGAACMSAPTWRTSRAQKSRRSAISTRTRSTTPKPRSPGRKARAFKDYHELLAQPEMDAVLITTPVYLHPEHFEAAVPSGKHIYCEKPAGADVAGVKRLLRASDKPTKSRPSSSASSSASAPNT